MKSRGGRNLLSTVCLLFALALLSACGGGGGTASGGGTSHSPSRYYTGSTSPATITQANAAALSANAYQNGGIASGISVAGVAVQLTGNPASAPALQSIAAVLKDGAAKAVAADASAGARVMGLTQQMTIYGAVKGSADYTISIDTATGNFTGSILFHSYQEEVGGAAVTGTVTIQGNYSSSTGAFTSLTMTFDPLTGVTSSGTAALHGSISFTTSGSSEVMTISFDVQSNGIDYRIENWTFTLTSDGRMTITGRYYDPFYGYVDLSTPTPLTVNSLSGQPTSGALLFTGANGSVAKMTFSTTGYSIYADVNGNGQWAFVQ